MDKKITFAALLIATALGADAKSNSDPVLMTINGNDVPLSEFVYLYEKNNSQQLEPMSLEQYLDMFVDYKLKVADALDAGIDTTQSFIKEYNKFRGELAAPYLADPTVNEELLLDVYDRLGQEVMVSHIMFSPISSLCLNGEEQADSVRQAILNGEISFEEAAARYSVDRSTKTKGGVMGWIPAAGRVPWQFETAAFHTPVGELSEVINSGYGYHIVKPLEKRQSPGEVRVEHILVLTQGKTAAQAAAAKQLIDSLYAVVTQPDVNFGEIAKQYSEDPGSAKKGGDLGWFGSGRMVPEFDALSFSLPVGAISEPFATSYGYHIIHKTGQRETPIPTLDEAREGLQKAIDADSRKMEPLHRAIAKKGAETRSVLTPHLQVAVAKYLRDNGVETIDDCAIALLGECDIVAYTLNGEPVTVGQIVTSKNPMKDGTDVNTAAVNIYKICNSELDGAIKNMMTDQLEATDTEFRNLSREYRDGIMLFDIANQKVWDKASKDTEGLNAYFDANRDNYKWDAPKFKGYLVQCASDSIRQEAMAYTSSAEAQNLTPAQISANLKKKFARNIKIDQVIAAKGENAVTDYIAFDGPEPNLSPNAKLRYFFAYDGKILEQPQSTEDCKGQVVTDYQGQLEKEWLQQLHKKYPVKVNKKALKQLQK